MTTLPLPAAPRLSALDPGPACRQTLVARPAPRRSGRHAEQARRAMKKVFPACRASASRWVRSRRTIAGPGGPLTLRIYREPGRAVRCCAALSPWRRLGDRRSGVPTTRSALVLSMAACIVISPAIGWRRAQIRRRSGCRAMLPSWEAASVCRRKPIAVCR
jgi:hypothetical protein